MKFRLKLLAFSLLAATLLLFYKIKSVPEVNAPDADHGAQGPTAAMTARVAPRKADPVIPAAAPPLEQVANESPTEPITEHETQPPPALFGEVEKQAPRLQQPGETYSYVKEPPPPGVVAQAHRSRQ